ncbi:MAG TPA: response regulator, partial [Desulfopila sp.]|nr:response regulator [Desulfopila sp.]
YIDDDESVAMVNGRILESLGYSVTVFLSSREACACFSESSDRFDLVITDMAMPEMTGDVLSKKILKIRGDIPIILCTGYSESMDENRARQLGIAEVMMKPITRFDLALTVRKVLGFG